MNIHAPLRLALALLVAPVACGPSGATPSAKARTETADSIVPRESPGVSGNGTDRVPARIYYELTRYDWYRQGRPLLVDGVAYRLSGAPVRVSAAKLERAGTFEGVDYYRDHGAPGLVFVPVYPGYWQPFATAEEPSSATTE